MITTIIVDDERVARQALRELLIDDGEFEILAECSNGKAAVSAIKEKQPQVVFLDVRMPELDGFQIIQSVGLEKMPLTVFVTAYDKYAVKAFESQALDYVLKPFEETRIARVLERIKRRLRDVEGAALKRQFNELVALSRKIYLDRIAIKSGGRILFLNMSEIRWIESAGNYLRFCTVDQSTHEVRETMNDLEQRLDPARFVRIHRSTIINLEHIKELKAWYTGEYAVVMAGGKELTLSRGYRDQLSRLMSFSLKASKPDERTGTEDR